MGPQEEFYNCADIEIRGGSNVPQPTWVPTAVQTSALPSNSVPISTTQANQWVVSSSISNQLDTTTIAMTTRVPSSSATQVSITSAIVQSSSTTQNLELDQTTDKYAFKGRIVCTAVGLYAKFQTMMKFCYENCSSPDRACPTDKCYCVWLP
jgi:predicted carbohydrate-binding protein with CBM5 and CBM33 domain